MPEIVVLGEALIDLFAEAGVGLRDARALHPSPGGAPANVAAALGRLGSDVCFIGRVGEDEFGHYLIATLASHGVDTRHLLTDARAPTMRAVVASPRPDEQHFILYNGANELLEPAGLPTTAIETAAVFVYGSVTLATRSRDAALAAAELAAESATVVVFDVNLRPALWPDLEQARAHIETALATATIIKVNEQELAFLTGTSDLGRGSEQLLARGAALCCVSLGDEGAFFATGKARGHVPAFDVRVANTTGSGDAFVAGLALKLSRLEEPVAALEQAELAAMIRFANACGALVASHQGAMGTDLELAAVEDLVRGCED